MGNTISDILGQRGHEAGTPEFFDLPLASLGLVDGTNTIAVQVANTAIGSSDLSFDARLTGNDPSPDCPTALTCVTQPGRVVLGWTVPFGIVYDSIAITRDGAPVVESEAMALLVDAVRLGRQRRDS